MSDSTPRRPRHALADGADVPAQPPADDPTQVLPAVPAPRSELSHSASAPVPPPRAAPAPSEPPTTRVPVTPPPAPRAPVSPPTAGMPPREHPAPSSTPPWAGPAPVSASSSQVLAEPRRRAVTAALAGVTALLLVGGIVVGIDGGPVTDLSDRPAPTTTP